MYDLIAAGPSLISISKRKRGRNPYEFLTIGIFRTISELLLVGCTYFTDIKFQVPNTKSQANSNIKK
jgi:hypothetical protein